MAVAVPDSNLILLMSSDNGVPEVRAEPILGNRTPAPAASGATHTSSNMDPFVIPTALSTSTVESPWGVVRPARVPGHASHARAVIRTRVLAGMDDGSGRPIQAAAVLFRGSR